MKRLLSAAVLAVALLAACGGTNRPEGIVERWLISLNQGKAGRPGLYAPERLSQRILPHWASRDPGDLDVIEVGRGDIVFQGTPVLEGRVWRVPFRIERTSGVKLEGLANVVKPGGSWRVDGIRIGDFALKVRSSTGVTQIKEVSIGR